MRSAGIHQLIRFDYRTVGVPKSLQSAYTYIMSSQDPVKVAEVAGFDIALIEHSLELTPEQRAYEHQSALDLVWELEKIRDTRNEESK